MRTLKTYALLLGFWALGLSPLLAGTYAVVCGISKYQQSPLTYSDDDAAAFYNWLISQDGGRTPSKNITLLINEQATRDAILGALRAQFAKAGPDDTVIFFFSGHGSNVGTFVPYGGESMSQRSAHLTHEAVRDAYKSCRAKTKLCFADACFAGKLLSPSNEMLADDAMVFQSAEATDFPQESRVAIMMSSRSNEASAERRELKQGIFTYYLLKGLRGRADANDNGLIEIGELFAYVSKNTITQSNGGQHPVLTGQFPRDMPLLRYR